MSNNEQAMTYNPALLENENMTNETQEEWIEEQKASARRVRIYSMIVAGMKGVSKLTLREDYADEGEFEKDIHDYYLAGVQLKYQLTGRQYETLVYYFVDQLTVRQIAEKTDCTRQNVEKTLKQIATKLKGVIKV